MFIQVSYGFKFEHCGEIAGCNAANHEGEVARAFEGVEHCISPKKAVVVRVLQNRILVSDVNGNMA